MTPKYRPNAIVDGWTLIDLLGEGGNAEVWRARRNDHGVRALKILTSVTPKSEPYRRFTAEVEVMSLLQADPGVLPLVAHSLPEFPSKQNPAWLSMPVA